MRKPKIYLDTSVISHLLAEETPEKMNDTILLWEEIKQGKFDVVLSSITIQEMTKCSEPKRSIMFEYLNGIDFTLLEITPDAEYLANEIIRQGILTHKSMDDCTHIACAVINNCDMIVSWNFKHIVNVKTINGVRAISLLNRYHTIDIYAPNMLLERGE